jgi:hypothetical protein
MSDVAPPAAPGAAPGPAGAPTPGGCPISADFLPANYRKHVDPAAPVPIRMMAARAMVPLSNSDKATVLYMLTFDHDAGVRDAAAKTATTLPDVILASALRDESVKPPALGYFLRLLWEKDAYAEMLILNASTPDDAVAEVAHKCSLRCVEIIGQNQLRLLRHDDVVRQLCTNPNATPALIDGVCDFAVRSGLILADVPQMKEARVRLYGPEAAERPPDPGPTADEVIRDYHELVDENASPLEERKRLTLNQRVVKMSVAEKIKLATLGNKEARGILIRDTNRLVARAVIESPRITDGEVIMAASSRSCSEDVLRGIYSRGEWTKLYQVKLALVKNPKTPLGIALKWMAMLRDSDVRELCRDKNVPSAVRMQAKKMDDKKTNPKKDH